VELKIGYNSQQKIQEEVEKYFTKKGLPYHVCKSLEEFKKLITPKGKLKKRRKK